MDYAISPATMGDKLAAIPAALMLEDGKQMNFLQTIVCDIYNSHAVVERISKEICASYPISINQHHRESAMMVAYRAVDGGLHPDCMTEYIANACLFLVLKIDTCYYQEHGKVLRKMLPWLAENKDKYQRSLFKIAEENVLEAIDNRLYRHVTISQLFACHSASAEKQIRPYLDLWHEYAQENPNVIREMMINPFFFAYDGIRYALERPGITSEETAILLDCEKFLDSISVEGRVPTFPEHDADNEEMSISQEHNADNEEMKTATWHGDDSDDDQDLDGFSDTESDEDDADVEMQEPKRIDSSPEF
jgi:hypothetical protein